MCGICGIVAHDDTSREILMKKCRTMLDCLYHRGPDSQDIKEYGSAILGHARLSIIDLSDAGHQPISNEDGSIALIFNGEIYNYQGLRQKLIQLGHDFISNTDSEVLIHGYEEWGMDQLLEYCDGMWAFALWDFKNQSLYLARDRFGEKPLFYSYQDNKLYFSSTLESLCASLDKMPTYNPEAVLEYLAYGYVPADTCIFDSVEKVPPATYIHISKNTCEEVRYWTLNYSDELTGTHPKELEDELESLLEDAVKSRLVADVPVGAFLSGGIDSSLIVAMMARNKIAPLTFTMRVPGTHRDEGHYARLVAEQFKTKHIEIILDNSCVLALPRLVKQVGEPFADSSIIPAQFTAQKIRQYAKVVLGGDGGDEAFGGYRAIPYFERIQQLNEYGFRYFKPIAPFLLRHIPNQNSRYATLWRGILSSSGFDSYMQVRGLYDLKLFEDLLGSKLKTNNFHLVSRHLFAALSRSSAKQWYQKGLALGYFGKMSGDFMTKIDAASMCRSLEARSPFLTRSLVEFAAKLPAKQIANERSDKVLLKNLARKIIPAECVDRVKSGFSIPIELWMQGPWKSLVSDLLVDGIAVQEGLLSRDGLQKSLSQSEGANARFYQFLYRLLNLELWLRLFVYRDKSVTEVENMIKQRLDLS